MSESDELKEDLTLGDALANYQELNSFNLHGEALKYGSYVRGAIKQSQAFYRKGELYKALMYSRTAERCLERWQEIVAEMIKRTLQS